MYPKPIEFLRKKDYVLEKELGQGACGQTVVIYDPTIEERFVCKKYLPIYEGLKETLFLKFYKGNKTFISIKSPEYCTSF